MKRILILLLAFIILSCSQERMMFKAEKQHERRVARAEQAKQPKPYRSPARKAGDFFATCGLITFCWFLYTELDEAHEHNKNIK